MGIRRLKQLLYYQCSNRSIHYFPSVSTFIQEEKKRLYRISIAERRISSPIKQMQLKNTINNSPYIVGIDANLYVAKYSRIFKKIEYGFLRQILITLSSKMIPVYIFDGNFPDQKRTIIDNRRRQKRKNLRKLNDLLQAKGITRENLSSMDSEKMAEFIRCICNQNVLLSKDNNVANLLFDYKNLPDECQELIKLYQKSVNVSSNDIERLQKFLDLLKIPYIVATNEADDMLAYLYRRKIINACQSEDMDMLPKGCGNYIQITNKGVVQYLLPEILKELDLTQHQFVDLCVLLGSDYYTGYLPKMEPIKLYDSFKTLKEPSLENFVSYYSTFDPSIKLHLDAYLKARKLFIACNESLEKIPEINLSPLSMDQIMKYLESLGLFISNKDISKLKLSLKNVNTYISEIATNAVRC